MSRRLSLILVLALLTVGAVAIHAQTPPVVQSPEVQADGRVTFRFFDPGAKEVQLNFEGAPKLLPMTRDDSGLWSITLGPLDPDLYGYIFIADGVYLLDPNNSSLKPNLLQPQNVVEVSGPTPQLWDVAEVPHGVIHHHFFKSKVVGDQRDFYVYTPPGFDPKAKTKYPVFYLLHGFSDSADGWTAVGKANVILDNLIAQSKVKPMIVVMPLGYGTPEMIKLKQAAWNHPDVRQQNFDGFRKSLLTEVMPMVEGAYPVSTKREDRAIAGLSMGGSESLLTGLNNIDKFAYVGSFSAGGLSDDYEPAFPTLDAKQASQLRTLWIACGTSDRLNDDNRKFKAWLKSKDIAFTDIETPGAHTWMVWRRNLINFAPLLFTSK
ncbi:MAG TPA: alpha/beta hydrolase-fold protein [Candidatus Limnocylindrales bacterium]|jgi:enterochelin esterase-like enzyme|nr:alpha/beta hydrolase-fold protein [Candidatus Limnocylindrales bacterium]